MFYCVLHRNHMKSIGFILFCIVTQGKAQVLLCFAQEPKEKHWFRCVLQRNQRKTYGFIVFCIGTQGKALVLLRFAYEPKGPAATKRGPGGNQSQNVTHRVSYVQPK